MRDHHKYWSIVAMARALEVSKSGYYTWFKADKTICKTAKLDVLVRSTFVGFKSRYG